jgi:hypothetical protein
LANVASLGEGVAVAYSEGDIELFAKRSIIRVSDVLKGGIAAEVQFILLENVGFPDPSRSYQQEVALVYFHVWYEVSVLWNNEIIGVFLAVPRICLSYVFIVARILV